MARFRGKVGYGEQIEAKPGVWEDQITEFVYQGTVIETNRQLEQGDKVNGDISVGNSIEIVADEFANANFLKIKYVVWAGVYWTVTSVKVRRPRLILSLGGVYNGPKA